MRNDQCTLRAAIEQANADSGADDIDFAIPGIGIQTLLPAAPLPAITDPAEIDASTQPGYTGHPLIELNGLNAGPAATGLSLRAGDSSVRGLIVNRFDGDGIDIGTGHANLVAGNYIGTDASGQNDAGNGGYGVVVFNSASNRIGGLETGDGNVISGNGLTGVHIGVDLLVPGPPPDGNHVEGNIIGLNAAGNQRVPNDTGGVVVSSGSVNVSGSVIGGAQAGARNVISANGAAGVVIEGKRRQRQLRPRQLHRY